MIGLTARRATLVMWAMLLCGCAGPQHASTSVHHPEKYYQNQWCNKVGGSQEYRLEDGTRVDCLTETHAVEFDFAKKWAEGIGQALYYAEMTGKRPGVVLIMEHPGDDRFKTRLQRVSDRHGITVWTIGPNDLDN